MSPEAPNPFVRRLQILVPRIRWTRRLIWGVWLGFPALIAAAAVISILINHAILPPAPKQPIDFSHRVMAGDMGIDCYFCHPTPAVSPNAGIPPVQKCLFCHNVIAVGSVAEMRSYASKGQGIPWVRVAKIPDYVRFNHECHIAAGHTCTHCHGQVNKMKRVRVAHNFDMNYCVACHRRNGVPVDCFLCHY